MKYYTGEEIAQGAKSGQWAQLNQRNGAVFAGAPVPKNVNASVPGHTAQPVAKPSWQSIAPSQRLRSRISDL